VRCASAVLVDIETDFSSDQSGNAEEFEVITVSVRLYNEGYAPTWIADAYVEIERSVPFARFLRRKASLGRFTEMRRGGKPDERLIGVHLTEIAQPGGYIACRFATSNPLYVRRHPEGSRFKYRLVTTPMRHKPLKVLLRST
jgi:hypothetical protein